VASRYGEKPKRGDPPARGFGAGLTISHHNKLEYYETIHRVNVSVQGGIILKSILRSSGVRMWIRFIWLRMGQLRAPVNTVANIWVSYKAE
jgi:hypothetical protein